MTQCAVLWDHQRTSSLTISCFLLNGSYKTIWSLTLPKVIRHSRWWSYTVTPSIDQTIHKFFTLWLSSNLLPNWIFYLKLLYVHTIQPTNPRPMPTDFYGLVEYDRVKLHSHQTADQPPTNADQFLWLGRLWLGKKLPALIEERIFSRSTPAVSALYPWCTHAQIPIFPTYPRPSGWPIPVLHDQPSTYSWYNYARYAQYRNNPRSNFYSRPQMNNSIKC